jgi:hypothetical protein
MCLDTITDEMPVANIADRFVRPGTLCKDKLILAKFPEENKIAISLTKMVLVMMGLDEISSILIIPSALIYTICFSKIR